MLPLNQIICGDSLEVLKTLPDESVDCTITSPPYWGLRDYGTAKWERGDVNCDHHEAKEKSRYDYSLENSPIQNPNDTRVGTDAPKWKDICPSCGAKKVDNQIGLEKTPEEYVAKMVEVFREVKRVLKKEGTLWLNLGDSYSGSGVNDGRINAGISNASRRGDVNEKSRPNTKIIGLKPKDLVGIPWRVAFALQADGWYLRQDLIWAKPNPMPESVTDRCTKSHEYVFLLAKSPKYYFDAGAIKEPYTQPMNRWGGQKLKADGESTWDKGTGQATYRDRDMRPDPNGRNKRSVWTITTKPFKEAHFATFPEDLIVPMVLAGCPKGGIVLDPFIGSGTTGLVAKKLGRNYLGIELNPLYVTMAEKRIGSILL